MKLRNWILRYGFWPMALLWLPAGVVAQAVRFMPDMYRSAEPGMLTTAAASLAVLVPCGLPLPLGCRRLWRLGYRHSAWWIGILLGAVSVVGSMIAGLLGPVAIAACTALLSLPAWGASFWLSRKG